MTLLEFMSNSPFLSAFIVLILGLTVESVVRMIVYAIKQKGSKE